MKTIVLLGVLALLLLFLNWRREHLDVETSNDDLGPMIDISKAQSLLKSWGPDKIEKPEESTIETFDGDLGPQMDVWKSAKLQRSWEPDPTEFERIQRKIDKKADSRNPKAKAIACGIDLTKGATFTRYWNCHWWGGCSMDADYNNHVVYNLAKGNWNAEEFLKSRPECNTALPVMNEDTAAMKCALDNNKLDDIVELVARNLKAGEYLQKTQCQGYLTTDDMFI